MCAKLDFHVLNVIYENSKIVPQKFVRVQYVLCYACIHATVMYVCIYYILLVNLSILVHS